MRSIVEPTGSEGQTGSEGTAPGIPGAPGAAGEAVRTLLRSVVDVARAIFGAAASSVFLLDEAAGELVFQAVSGEGEEFLVGTRMAADRGIAGWVVASGQAMAVDDLATAPVFDRDFAAATAYVPQALMAAPLLSEGRTLGVLEVLDPVPQSRASLGDLDLLALFANQAAIALRVVDDCTARDGAGTGPQTDADLIDALRDLLRRQGGSTL